MPSCNHQRITRINDSSDAQTVAITKKPWVFEGWKARNQREPARSVMLTSWADLELKHVEAEGFLGQELVLKVSLTRQDAVV